MPCRGAALQGEKLFTVHITSSAVIVIRSLYDSFPTRSTVLTTLVRPSRISVPIKISIICLMVSAEFPCPSTTVSIRLWVLESSFLIRLWTFLPIFTSSPVPKPSFLVQILDLSNIGGYQGRSANPV